MTIGILIGIAIVIIVIFFIAGTIWKPINYFSSPQFGQSTKTLAIYLRSGGQSGGLNPLYQIGGPRLIQLAQF